MTAASVSVLRELGALSPLDEHFANAVARLGGEDDPRVLLAAALASRAVQAGHVCLDLPRLARDGLALEGDAQAVSLVLPELEGWLAALRESPLTHAARNAPSPLHLDPRGRLYLQRYFEYERGVSTAIQAQLERPPERVEAAALRAGLDRLFGRAREGTRAGQLELFGAGPDAGAGANPIDEGQRLAAERAARSRFCVISGGPGTGKTSTVVKILALLVEQALARGAPPPRTHLLAPTGKAAARLKESIRRAKAALPAAPEVVAAIADDASTIHRALGALGGSSGRFRHGPDAPLATDLVVVDEASMVDLALMAHLLSAVPASARLILLGDKDQLASVEAGAVLGDVCGAGLEEATRRGRKMAERIALLTHSYRYPEHSGIRRLSEAIRAGDAARALEVLRDPGAPDVTLVPPARPGELSDEVLERAVAGFAPAFGADSAGGKLQALERFRVLCAHRRGPFGQLALNRRIEAELRASGWIASGSDRYPGRVLMVTQNDYPTRLFNGEVGVLLADTGNPARLLAHFPSDTGGLRTIAAARLPRHESAYALSVHKSQGSEFDEIAVVLPGEPSPILSRELLYTAVTRARARVVVYASADVIELAVRTTVQRASGLREALWGSP